MPSKTGACKLGSGMPLERGSADLLSDEGCLPSFDAYSIRFHDSTNMHIDYAIGSENLKFCIDFIVPKTLDRSKLSGYERHQYAGMEGTVLSARQIAPFLPSLPARGEKFQLMFQPVHGVEVILAEKGEIQEIEKGTYGAGEWFVVEKGKASMEKVKGKVTLSIGGRSFYITTGPYNLLIGR